MCDKQDISLTTNCQLYKTTLHQNSKMKYLDLETLHELDRALNFDTNDSAVIGACEVWTIKAAGGDKKLYKRIERTLEDRHKELLAAVENLGPKSAAQFSDSDELKLNLARVTPFGSFKEPANRHTFAYLIATLNATHIDYDFANTCNTNEFHRETREGFVGKINTTMFHLRPNIYPSGLPQRAFTPTGNPIWSQRSWQLLDSEMDMARCEYYGWEPDEDPFSEDGAIWSYHYFLYNKERKRVCYFYLRGVSALASPPYVATSLMTRFRQAQSESSGNVGSRKRAEYWLGGRAKKALETYGSSDELDDFVIDHPNEIVHALESEAFPVRQTTFDIDYWSTEDDSEVEDLKEREADKANDKMRTWFESRAQKNEA